MDHEIPVINKPKTCSYTCRARNVTCHKIRNARVDHIKMHYYEPANPYIDIQDGFVGSFVYVVATILSLSAWTHRTPLNASALNTNKVFFFLQLNPSLLLGGFCFSPKLVETGHFPVFFLFLLQCTYFFFV